MDLKTALKNAEGTMTIFGNINPAGTLLTGKTEEVYAEVCKRIKVADGRSYIPTTGCDMFSTTSLENFKILLKACRDSV